MSDKYEQLKKNMKHLTERYEQGILTGTLDSARIAISDLQAEIESLKAITELAVNGLKDIENITAATFIEDKCRSILNKIERLSHA